MDWREFAEEEVEIVLIPRSGSDGWFDRMKREIKIRVIEGMQIGYRRLEGLPICWIFMDYLLMLEILITDH